MLTWLPIICLALSFLATIICVRCSGNTQRMLERCREEQLDTKDHLDQCKKIFRERKDKLDERDWTNLDVEYITEIKLKVLQTINNNNTNMTALKFAVMDLLDEELENL